MANYTLSGRIMNRFGQPADIQWVQAFTPHFGAYLGIQTQSDVNGRYSLVVPAQRVSLYVYDFATGGTLHGGSGGGGDDIDLTYCDRTLNIVLTSQTDSFNPPRPIGDGSGASFPPGPPVAPGPNDTVRSPFG